MAFFQTLMLILAGIMMAFVSSGNAAGAEDICNSTIFCNGTILHTIQMARLFKDSKTFVDRPIKEGLTEEDVEQRFHDLLAEYDENETPKEEIEKFVAENFDAEGTEYIEWTPSDWAENPTFLSRISDPTLKKWAAELHSFWRELGRKMSEKVMESPERYTVIPVRHPVIVPGGRFREFFYWDSYWIQIGLIHSEMLSTVEGMIENFLDMVEEYGFVPNGGRIYFTRSQPPLLIPMAKNYAAARGENGTDYIRRILPTLTKEFSWWVNNRMFTVTKGLKTHQMFRYNSEQAVPRPESYREDYEIALHLSDADKEQLYTDLHSGAESGWDFSSRWWIAPKGMKGNLSYTRTSGIIPADLNGFMYLNAVLMSEFYEMVGDEANSTEYSEFADKLGVAIDTILWDDTLGSWFDYEIESGNLRKYFYVSNIVPLWAGVHRNDYKVVKRVVDYLHSAKALEFYAGVPTSLQQTGEQWDYPNGWAPLQHLLVDALDKSGVEEAREIARKIADDWIIGNYRTYDQTNKTMFEKYDVTIQSGAGGGGEYETVIGFGWTNGVILDFLDRFGDELEIPSGAVHISPWTSTTITIGCACVLLASIWG